jgi:hypothetical protein
LFLVQVVEKMSHQEKEKLKEEIANSVPKDVRELLGDRALTDDEEHPDQVTIPIGTLSKRNNLLINCSANFVLGLQWFKISKFICFNFRIANSETLSKKRNIKTSTFHLVTSAEFQPVVMSAEFQIVTSAVFQFAISAKPRSFEWRKLQTSLE